MRRIVQQWQRIRGTAVGNGIFLDRLIIVAIFVFYLVYFAGLSQMVPPVPVGHDDFGNLLIADTFAHGRLANPVSPFHSSFEAMHTLTEPSYTGKYPIGLPLFLAFGQVIFASPVAGSWISVALAVAMIYWAVRPLLSRQWSLLGTLLVGRHPLIVEWSHQFWGCGVSVLGGALVFGAIVRLWQAKGDVTSTRATGLIFGVGLSLLGLSRPYEGVVFAVVCCLIWLVPGLFLAKRRQRVGQAVIGAALPLAFTLIIILIYNRTVTGSMMTLPYMEYTRRFDPVPLFIWQQAKPLPTYANPLMLRCYQSALQQWEAIVQGGTFHLLSVAFSEKSLMSSLNFYMAQPQMRVMLLIAMAGSIVVRRERWVQCLTLSLLCFIPFVHLTPYFEQLHRYSSPAIVCMSLFLVAGMRALWIVLLRKVIPRLERRRVNTMVCSLFCGYLCLQYFLFLTIFLVTSATGGHRHATLNSKPGNIARRAEIEAQLIASHRKHLIFLSYTKDHSAVWEWGYNKADIDSAPVVWAQNLGPQKNAGLIAYFKDREIHYLTVGRDEEPLQWTPESVGVVDGMGEPPNRLP